MKVYINKDLEGKELKDLLLFVSNISNKMSLARYYNGKNTLEEFNEMQKEYKKYILDEYELRCYNYKENVDGYKERLMMFSWIKTDEDAYQHFSGMLEQDLENFATLEERMDYCEERIPYPNMPSDFLYHNFTRTSSVTRGPVFEMFYYNIGVTFDKLRMNVKTLFEFPYNINDFPVEDMCLYKDNYKKLAICSHEKYAFMELDEGEYNKFLEFKMEHEAFIR